MSGMIKNLADVKNLEGKYDIISLGESVDAYIVNCQAKKTVDFNDPVEEGLYISFVGKNNAHSPEHPDYPAEYFAYHCLVSLIPAPVPHNQIMLPKNGKIESIRIHFPLQHELTKSLIPGHQNSPFKEFDLYESGWQMSLTGELRKVAVSIWENQYKETPRRLWMQGKIRELLALMLVQEAPNSLVEQACEQVAKKPHINWTIPMLTKELATNECYLKQAFRKKFNMGVSSWIQSYRIELAKERLIYQDQAITKIALDLGYQSSSYFAKVFKQQTGMSPKLYRKNLVES